MKQKRRSTAFTLTLLCAFFALLLTACGGSHTQSGKVKYHTQKVSQNAPRAASKDEASATPGLSGRTEYVGEIPDMNAWLAIASDGKNMLAFTTDGNPDHTATFAQWYMGSIINNNVQATPVAQGGTPTATATPQATAQATPQVTATATGTSQGQLTAQLGQNAAIGKVTLSNGKSFPFTANTVADPNSKAGLYGSMETINNTKYQAGWIIPPNAIPSATTTPGTSSTGTPGTSSTGTPAATSTPTAMATATGTATSGANPAGASAVINEQTGQLLPAPLPSAQDLTAKQIAVPNLGTFSLRH
jgi:hypothetical protein